MDFGMEWALVHKRRPRMAMEHYIAYFLMACDVHVMTLTNIFSRSLLCRVSVEIAEEWADCTVGSLAAKVSNGSWETVPLRLIHSGILFVCPFTISRMTWFNTFPRKQLR